MYSIGIDIGGMSAKIGLISHDNVVLEEIIPTDSNLDYELFIGHITDVIKDICSHNKVDKIGISSCGLINSKLGAIVYSNNIKWDNKNIVGDIQNRTNLPVKIANDAKCAALAEAVFGIGKEYKRMCMITLGTGVGGAFIINKKLESGNAYGDADGILGHISVENGGRQCTCGRRGCLEAYSSATAIMQSYKERTGQQITAKEIFDNVRINDPSAVATMEEFQYYLGEGLVSLVNVLRPEVIAIGGGVAKSSDLFLDYLNSHVNSQTYGGIALPVKIVSAKLGNTAGMIGATLL
ncbi:ROK family protein [Lachnoclostridium sp.]|uniref:ROK family protein n=1 Tax=Lachnoclostridium sp. TaxID=2028282 RepID=UPI00289C5FB4|nr:ROK family protein [Lachnoclostridium sp.]